MFDFHIGYAETHIPTYISAANLSECLRDATASVVFCEPVVVARSCKPIKKEASLRLTHTNALLVNASNFCCSGSNTAVKNRK